ncbi:MAG: arsenical pump-driving ATPase [Bdellovibrionales bacterium]|nr:arsenical pump-driving ATPase [Bdellovibrionales bacterium]
MTGQTQEIHFVTGKGGVGKSLIAAALALSKAELGLKTLLVELGELSYYSHFFHLPSVGYNPMPLSKDLDLALWNGSESLKEYARHLLKVEALYHLFFENQVSRSLVNVAPALPELAILGKITSSARKQGPPVPYDVIVVDAFATGHFLSLLRGPRGMAEAIRIGAMGEQSRKIDEILFKSPLCHFHIVCLPEELPIQETLELHKQLRTEFGVEARIILNRVVKTNLRAEDLKTLTVEAESSAFIEFLEVQIERTRSGLRKLTEACGHSPKQISFFSQTDPWALTKSAMEDLK